MKSASLIMTCSSHWTGTEQAGDPNLEQIFLGRLGENGVDGDHFCDADDKHIALALHCSYD